MDCSEFDYDYLRVLLADNPASISRLNSDRTRFHAIIIPPGQISSDMSLEFQHLDFLNILSEFFQVGLEALSHKDLTGSESIIIPVDPEALQDDPADLLGMSTTGVHTRGQKATIPLSKMAVFEANGVSGFPDPDCLQHTGVPELLKDDRHVKLHGSLVTVGLDTANKVRMALRQRTQKLVK
jgi:hypothetical protein